MSNIAFTYQPIFVSTFSVDRSTSVLSLNTGDSDKLKRSIRRRIVSLLNLSIIRKEEYQLWYDFDFFHKIGLALIPRGVKSIARSRFEIL